MTTFGELLKRYRTACRIGVNQRLTQENLIELLHQETGVSYSSGSVISEWERDKNKIDKDNRKILIALLRIFYQFGGITHEDEASWLLSVGNYRALSTSERLHIFSAKTDKKDSTAHLQNVSQTNVDNNPFLFSQLPPPSYTKLFGLNEKANRIASHLSDKNKPHIFIIQGLGGIGKTALAHCSSHLYLKNNYSSLEAVLWVSAKQQYLTDSGVINHQKSINLIGIFDELAQKLSLQHLIRLPLLQKIEELSKHFKRLPYLVIIDNLETVDDFTGIVPLLAQLTRPTKFLLTSRSTVPSPYQIAQVSLSELSKEASFKLISHIADQKKLSAVPKEEVYKLVGGNPLAIILVVSQMKLFPSEVILKSVASGSRSEIYTYIYRQAWSALSLEAKDVLFALLQSGESTTWSWLDTLLPISASEMQNALAELIELSLVNAQQIERELNYSMHRLTATFLRTDILGWK